MRREADVTTDPIHEVIDTSVPHSARVWNYWLGGKDHYAVDRAAGEQYRKINPGIVDTARDMRAFLGRAVRYLAGDVGVRQFLDVGTGLPTAGNTHEVAQQTAPSSRVVYVDNDPLVLTYARALLTSSAQGACDYIDADMRDPAAILAAASRTLDLTRPVALLFIGVLGHVSDDSEAAGIVAAMLAGLAPGSYLALTDGVIHERGTAATENYADSGAVPYHLRSREQISALFNGLELVDPGVVPVKYWPTGPVHATAGHTAAVAGVARKPA
jgi:hypothetical protein